MTITLSVTCAKCRRESPKVQGVDFAALEAKLADERWIRAVAGVGPPVYFCGACAAGRKTS